MEYVNGFLYDDRGRVVLIEKQRPPWQAGRLNGVGGKIEPGEHPDQAMRREFREEAGLDLEDWALFIRLVSRGSMIHIYRAFTTAAIVDDVRSMTDEVVRIASVADLGHQVIPNLRWLVPLGAHREGVHGPEQYEVTVIREIPR